MYARTKCADFQTTMKIGSPFMYVPVVAGTPVAIIVDGFGFSNYGSFVITPSFAPGSGPCP